MKNVSVTIRPLSVWAYVVSLALWLLLCIGAAGIVVKLNIRDVEKSLIQYGDAYSDHLNKQMVSSDTILKGFSALFAAIGETDPEKASRYVRQVLESNPHIFTLQIVQKVAQTQIVDFVALKRNSGMPNFSLKAFSYDSGRKWQALQEKAYYYPIVFIEPMRLASEDVLGLDMESAPFLKQAIAESLQRHVPVASHPFRLVEDHWSYVVFYPIAQTFKGIDSPFALDSENQLVVDMVIDVARLVEVDKFPVKPGETVVIYHQDFEPYDPKGQLSSASGDVRSAIETRLFPLFTYQQSLATLDGRFALRVTRQAGWSDLSIGLLAFMALLSLISSWILVGYLRAQQKSKLLQFENQNRLWHLANHDGLTGLPNRMLLMDRLNQLLARVQRQGKRLAVMFLDIDDFKRVNDNYGHEVGDQLLKFVAERLRAVIRAEDTAARMSGDEFILLIEAVENVETVEVVREKISQKLAEGILVDDQLICIRTSIGIAIFPEDGDNPDALIKQADVRMYEDKKNKAAGLRLV